MSLFILLIFFVQQAIPLLRCSRGTGGCLVQLPPVPHSHQGVGKRRADSYCVVAAGWGRKLSYPLGLGPPDTMTSGRGGREWKCHVAPPTTTSFSLMMLSGHGGSRPHRTPLTPSWWGFQSTDCFYQAGDRRPAPCSARPAREHGSPTRFYWGEVEDYLSTRHHEEEGSRAICFSEVEGMRGCVWRFNSWLSPAKTAAVGGSGFFTGV